MQFHKHCWQTIVADEKNILLENILKVAAQKGMK